MDSRDLQLIKHMKSYCEKVENSVRRFGSDFDVFNMDYDYCSSVSMSIMQIGELSIKLSDAFKDTTKGQIPWSAIRSMRNMYAHTYAKMSKKLSSILTKQGKAV